VRALKLGASGRTVGASGRIGAVVAVALLLGGAGLATTLPHTEPGSKLTVAATLVVVGLALLVSGVLGWVLRPASRVGPLLCLSALLWLVPYLQDSGVDVVASTAFLFRDLWLAALIHVAVTYPDGRGNRWTRGIAGLAYLRALVPNLVTALFTIAPVPLEHRNFFNVGSAPGLVDDVRTFTGHEVNWLIALAVVVTLALALMRGTRASRASALPLIVGTGLTLAYFAIQSFSCGEIAGWKEGGDAAGHAIIPMAFLLALTGGRRARRQMGGLLVDIADRPDSTAMREALARALRDPSVEIAYRVGPEGEWVTPTGTPAALPVDDPGRTVSYVERDGERVAAVVHDAALESEPERLEPVRRAVRLLLDNERLTAEVRRQVEEIRASRRRIVEEGDRARKAVERNLHDGAQQRLVGLALNLRLAQRAADPSTALLLEEFAGELESTIAELRELARGIHPSVVTESGLPTALAALAKRAPLPVNVDVDVPGRFVDAVEATVYYVAAEALTNVARYASASHASMTVFEASDILHLEVRDDGVGGAQVGTGSGLSGLRDRVDALGGALVVESPPGAGTRVIVQLPLSRRLQTPGHEETRDAQPVS
jgi:signal transduction histidine kinase